MKKYPMLLPLILLLLWNPGNTSINAIWVQRWQIVIWIAAITVVWKLNLEPLFKVTISYFVSRGLVTGMFGPVDEVTTLLQWSALSQIALLSCFLLFLNSKIDLKRSLALISWVLFWVVLFSPQPETETWLFNNPSMAATFIVLGTYCHPVTVFVTLLTKSWVSFGVFLAFYFWKFKKYILPGWFLFLVLGLTAYIDPSFRIPDNGRFDLWRQYFDWWVGQGAWTVAFGSGWGSGGLYLPTLGDTLTPWAHNDFLSILVETGVIGLTLFLLCFFKVFGKAKGKDQSLIFAYAIAMFFNFPLHLALPALVGWNLVKRTGISSSLSNQ